MIESNPNDLVSILLGRGYREVHTYRESHGEYYSVYFQRYSNPVMRTNIDTLELRVQRDGSWDFGPASWSENWLGAKLLREKMEKDPGNYIKFRDYTSSCSTAGWEVWGEIDSGQLFQLSMVVGHGEKLRECDKESVALWDKENRVSGPPIEF